MIPSLARTLTNVESIVLTVMPHGGQRSARRNAWASMSSNAAWARNRREADEAMSRALHSSQAQAVQAR